MIFLRKIWVVYFFKDVVLRVKLRSIVWFVFGGWRLSFIFFFVVRGFVRCWGVGGIRYRG